MRPAFSLTKKIVLFVSLFLAVQIILFLQMESLSTQAEYDFGEAVRAKEFLDEINEFTEEFYRFTRVAYDATKGEQFRVIDQFLSTLHALEKRAKTLRRLASDDVEKQTVSEAEDALLNTIQIAENLKARSADLAPSADLDWSKGERSHFRKELSRVKQVSTLGHEAREKVNIKFEQDKRLRHQGKMILVASLVFVALSTLLSAGFLLQHISRRLKFIQGNVHRLAAGVPLTPMLGGTDELGTLDANFHSMARQLEDAKRKEHALLNRAASIMCSFDATGRLTSANPASYAILGYQPEALIGSHYANFVAPKDIERVRGIMQSVDREEALPSFEATVVRKNGSLAETLWSVRRDDSNNSMLCVIHDVTERKQAENTRKDVIALLTAELQYPMQAIRVFLDALSRDQFGAQSEQGKGLLSLAMRSIRRMNNLVDDLLDAEKIKSGVMVLDLKEVAVSAVFDSSVAPLQSWASEFGVRLVFESNELKMKADEERVGRVLTNLVSNAVKYSPRDSKVSINADEVGDSIEIKIIDQGRGIPADAIDDLFKPFRQATTDDRMIGTGLGLSICKEIVELHGGTISVTSEEGRGSIFRFSIPKGGSSAI